MTVRLRGEEWGVQESRGAERLVAGRYRLAEVLGRGGMGVVWQATDELIGRVVAVKEIRPPAGLPVEEGALFGARALREARMAGRISHPAVVAIHDVVPAGAGDEAVYIVSELVRAPTLAELLHREGALPPPRVSVLAARILAAMAAAHAHGVVHRDIKPSNIMVLDGDEVKLVDFGIAQAADDPRLTRDGVMGSTGYLAPELFHGGQPTPETDLWAVGVTLAQAVVGVPPFERPSTAATIHAVLYDDLPAIPCDPPLATVIAGLLTREPADRMSLQQARSLLARAHPVVGGEPAMTTHQPTAAVDWPRESQRPQPDPGTSGEDWEQEPTNLHATPFDGPVSYRRSAASAEPGEEFLVAPPRSVRRRRISLVVLVILAWVGTFWLVPYADTPGRMLTYFATSILLAVLGLLAISRMPFAGRIEATEAGLIFRSQPSGGTLLDWTHVHDLAVVPVGTAAERSRITLRLTSTVPATVRSAPPLRGFLRPRPDRRPVYTVGDIHANCADVAMELRGVVPDQLAVTVATGEEIPRESRLVGPRPQALVLWTMTVVILIATIVYYRHHEAALVTLTEDAASAVAYSPDGTSLASVSDRTISLWDAATGRKDASLSGHADDVTALGFSPGGRLLASGDEDGTVKLWDVAAARTTLSLTIDDNDFMITSVLFSADGATLAALASSGAVGLWRLNSRDMTVPVDASSVQVIRFSADGRILLGIEREGERHAWQTTNGRAVRPTGVFGPVATIQDDGSVLIRDAGTGQILATLRSDDREIYDVAMGPGDLLATYDEDSIRVWRISTGREVKKVGRNSFREYLYCDSLAMRPDGRALACAGDDGLRVWTFLPEH